jgi:hypothetical protein
MMIRVHYFRLSVYRGSKLSCKLQPFFALSSSGLGMGICLYISSMGKEIQLWNLVFFSFLHELLFFSRLRVKHGRLYLVVCWIFMVLSEMVGE